MSLHQVALEVPMATACQSSICPGPQQRGLEVVQLEWKIGLAWANTRGILNSPSSLENPAVTREKPRGSPVIAR